MQDAADVLGSSSDPSKRAASPPAAAGPPLRRLGDLPLGFYIAAAVDAAKQAPARRKRVGAPLVVVALVAFFWGRGLLATGVRALFLEAFLIPSAGVAPTLLVGDHVFSDNLTPRLRAPHRGELIVFPSPEHREQTFVKRVVAVPGDSVQVEAGQLVINGWRVPRCRAGEWAYTDEG